ncbi:MAG: cytochrome P450 [Legionella sp.]
MVLNQPGLWQHLRTNPHELDACIEECNRLDTSVTFIFRVTKNETILGEQLIEKGKVIFISTHAINRDPHYFENPDHITLGAKQAHHFSYGYGSHFCLGAKLARIEMQSIFTALLERFPALCLDTNKPALRKHHSLSFSGFEHLHLKATAQFMAST